MFRKLMVTSLLSGIAVSAEIDEVQSTFFRKTEKCCPQTRSFDFRSLRMLKSDGIADRPNILVILADDLGYGDLSVQGGKDFKTPGTYSTRDYITFVYLCMFHRQCSSKPKFLMVCALPPSCHLPAIQVA